MRRIVPVIICLLLLSLAGCEFPIVGLRIDKYPNRLVYIVGIDDELDLSGGEVELLIQYSPSGHGTMERETDVSHEIDFSLPGVYVVTITRYKYSCQFPIQVVSKEYIEDLLTAND